MKTGLLLWFATLLAAGAQTNIAKSVPPTNSPAVRAEQMRAACIQGRRCVCGKIIQMVPEGIVVDSGYTALMEPPLNQSWLISRGPELSRNSGLMERNDPASPCVGIVLLTDIPKRPKPKLYDYVLLQAYPAGRYRYVPVAGVEKSIRRFSGGLATAVRIQLEADEK